MNADRLTFTTETTNTVLLEAVSDNTGLAAIGFEGVNTSNRINLNANIYDIRDFFKVPLALTGTDGDIGFGG